MEFEIINYNFGTEKKIECLHHIKTNTLWLSIKMMETLFDKTKRIISKQIKSILDENSTISLKSSVEKINKKDDNSIEDLKSSVEKINKKDDNSIEDLKSSVEKINKKDDNSVVSFKETVEKVKKIPLKASNNKTYQTLIYELEIVIEVGFKTRSKETQSFKSWATKILTGHIVDGYTLNEERLEQKPDKLEELYNKILAIRANEALDYSKLKEAISLTLGTCTQKDKLFWATKQNQLYLHLFKKNAITIIYQRFDIDKENYGMTACEKKTLANLMIAKNYLTKEELQDLNKLVNLILDLFLLLVKTEYKSEIPSNIWDIIFERVLSLFEKGEDLMRKRDQLKQFIKGQIKKS